MAELAFRHLPTHPEHFNLLAQNNFFVSGNDEWEDDCGTCFRTNASRRKSGGSYTFFGPCVTTDSRDGLNTLTASPISARRACSNGSRASDASKGVVSSCASAPTITCSTSTGSTTRYHTKFARCSRCAVRKQHQALWRRSDRGAVFDKIVEISIVILLCLELREAIPAPGPTARGGFLSTVGMEPWFALRQTGQTAPSIRLSKSPYPNCCWHKL
jgi:hypothetical protein